MTPPQPIPSHAVSAPFAIPGRSPSSPIPIGGRLGLGLPPPSPTSGSPIIGSSYVSPPSSLSILDWKLTRSLLCRPKKTWFSSLFSSYKEKSSNNEDRDRGIGAASSFTLKTTSSPEEIMAELQQAFLTLQIIFQPTHPNGLVAKYDGPDGMLCLLFFSLPPIDTLPP